MRTESVPRPKTRCGCEANFRVHIDIMTERWNVTCFTNHHNHELLDAKYNGMLPAHKKMSDSYNADEQHVECWY